MSKEKIYVTNIAMAFALPAELHESAQSQISDAINEILREHQRSFAQDYCLLDYQLSNRITEVVDVDADSYSEGDAIEAMSEAIAPSAAAMALINYVASARPEDPDVLLEHWVAADFTTIRKEWPDVPESIFEDLETPDQRHRSIQQALTSSKRSKDQG